MPHDYFFKKYFSITDRCVVVSHYGLDLHSLMTNDVEHLFMCLFVQSVYLFCEISLRLLHVFKLDFFF